MKDIIKTRFELLKSMDYDVRRFCENEEIFELWLAEGVPDGACNEDFISIAEDDELWNLCVDAYTTYLIDRVNSLKNK